MVDIQTGKVSQEEVEEFGLPWRHVNWGVRVGNLQATQGQTLVAIFQAQEEEGEEGCLAVHAKVLRRSLHPSLSLQFAHMFATDLLQLGATTLKAEIDVKHRAALRMAKAAGFVEETRDDKWVTLRRGQDGQCKISQNAK